MDESRCSGAHASKRTPGTCSSASTAGIIGLAVKRYETTRISGAITSFIDANGIKSRVLWPRSKPRTYNVAPWPTRLAMCDLCVQENSCRWEGQSAIIEGCEI